MFAINQFAINHKSPRHKNSHFFMKNAALVAFILVLGILFQAQTYTTKKFQETLTVFQTSSSTAIQKDQTLVSGEAKFTEYEELLYTATAGRSGEFFAIFRTMTAASWIFGHGSGFTYDLHRPNKETLFGHANSHFSPLGLAYKFGGPFMILFYVWVIYPLIKNNYSCQEKIFWAGILILLLFQSLFAFNLFVEFLFPVAIAALQSKKIVSFSKIWERQILICEKECFNCLWNKTRSN